MKTKHKKKPLITEEEKIRLLYCSSHPTKRELEFVQEELHRRQLEEMRKNSASSVSREIITNVRKSGNKRLLKRLLG